MTITNEKIIDIDENKNLIVDDSTNHVIKLDRVYRTYFIGDNKINALKEVNLTVKQGELLVILGPSGSGKTTLLNLVGGIDLPSKGDIFVDGVLLSSKKQMEKVRKEKIGFIFQFFNLLPNLTARENIEYVLELIKQKNTRQKAQEYLEMVMLGERGDHFPSQLSGGEQQRVAIARALAKNPIVLLADEPTGELDYETGIMILRILYDLVKIHKKTVIMVTHNQEIGKIADRVVRLSSGTIKSIEDKKNKQIQPEDLSW